MAAERKLLWLSPRPAPPNLMAALGRRWRLVPARDDEPLSRQLDSAGLAVARPNGRADDPHEIEKLLSAVDRSSAVAVVLLPSEANVAWNVLSRREGRLLCIRDDAEPGEIAAKLDAAGALQPAFRNLQAELAEARHHGRAPGLQLDELDEEMRLAARLQRDFLPRQLPAVGGVRFGALYRPLGWVSGDIYDVARLDETHVGFYVADAVGHGMPAALLTMFIKRAIPSKRIVGHSYEILPPHLSLEQLNSAICEQNLSSCEFCTAVYCVLDVASLKLSYARAGHPEPLLVRRDGEIIALDAPGSLLGVFPGEKYSSATVQLAAGDRLVLYSDGIEDALATSGDDCSAFRRRLPEIAPLPRDEALLQIAAWVDERPQTPRASDDVTILLADVERP
ncbi:MAG: SpoIIE family protein phosphatase [Planctomycetes bacterium]|nr:SpoIIE family protein phosphatase [Planctomycetota bacterium]